LLSFRIWQLIRRSALLTVEVASLADIVDRAGWADGTASVDGCFWDKATIA
jgi:hypothetical protein